MLLKYFTWISTKYSKFICSYEMFVIVEIWQLKICKSFAATFWSKRPVQPLKHKARAAINFNSAREFPTEKVKQNLNWEIPKRILQSHCSKCQLQILTKAIEQMYFLFHQISLIWTFLFTSGDSPLHRLYVLIATNSNWALGVPIIHCVTPIFLL